MEGTLTDFVRQGLALNVFDCDNPQKPERDESLGAFEVGLDCLRLEDAPEFMEALPTKGKLLFDVAWEPPAPAEEAASSVVSGDERVIIGNQPLLLRESAHRASPEVLKLPVGSRVQLHDVAYAPLEDGTARGRRVGRRVGCAALGRRAPVDERELRR